MKTIKTYLTNQKDLATSMYIQSMKEEKVNLITCKFWLERTVVIEMMLRELNEKKN